MDIKFFDDAFKEADLAYIEDEVPIGAVIVKDGEIIASAHNKKEQDHCCTSHAEILAIQKASNKYNNWRLENCDIYVTLDPCPMCASAIKQARIKNVFSGLNNSDFHNLELIQEIFKSDKVNGSVSFQSNLTIEKSRSYLNNFFEKQRNK